jgi:hypothetical protein
VGCVCECACVHLPATLRDCEARKAATKIDGSAVVASDAALPTATFGGGGGGRGCSAFRACSIISGSVKIFPKPIDARADRDCGMAWAQGNQAEHHRPSSHTTPHSNSSRSRQPIPSL